MDRSRPTDQKELEEQGVLIQTTFLAGDVNFKMGKIVAISLPTFSKGMQSVFEHKSITAHAKPFKAFVESTFNKDKDKHNGTTNSLVLDRCLVVVPMFMANLLLSNGWTQVPVASVYADASELDMWCFAKQLLNSESIKSLLVDEKKQK